MNRVALYTIATLLLAITTARSSAQETTNARQLQEVVVLGGKQKTLSSKGTRILGAVSMLNSIRDVTLQVAIYRDSTFTEVLGHPIVVDIPEGNRQRIVATPAERTLLQPGDYIVAITFVHCDEETQQQWTNSDQWDGQTRYQMMKQSIQFPLYLKAGYIRSTSTDTFEKCPANIGLKVKGRTCKKHP